MKIIASIAAITILVGIAIFKGIDGALLISAIAILGGLGGYTIGRKRPSGQK